MQRASDNPESLTSQIARLTWPILGAAFVVVMLAPLSCVLLYSFADRFSVTGALPPAYSLRWFTVFLHDPRTLHASEASLFVAVGATVIALLVGIPASWALSKPVRGRSVIEGVILLRAAVPVIVLGLGTAAVLYRLHAVDTWSAVILAHAAGGLPFIVWTVRPALSALDPDMDSAARDLGAGTVRRFALAASAVKVAILAGALLAFLFSLDEFAVTFLIAGQRIVTLPILLYGTIESNSVQAGAAVAVGLLVPSALVAVAASLSMRRLEAVGARRNG